jgi:hypothetical protein
MIQLSYPSDGWPHIIRSAILATRVPIHPHDWDSRLWNLSVFRVLARTKGPERFARGLSR